MMQQTNINQKCKAIYFVCVLYFQSFFYIINTINKNWNKSRTFKPENWCIYQSAICTNNDVEGWHKRLNSRSLGMGGNGYGGGGNGYGGEMTKGKNFMGGKWQKWYGGEMVMGGK